MKAMAIIDMPESCEKCPLKEYKENTKHED